MRKKLVNCLCFLEKWFTFVEIFELNFNTGTNNNGNKVCALIEEKFCLCYTSLVLL